MKSVWRTLVAVVVVASLSRTARAAANEEIPLWPDKEIHASMTVYQPDEQKRTGTAIVVCPGGGYLGLAITHEGDQIGRWLSSVGITGIVLKYRMPHAEAAEGKTPLPLLDAQRAIRIVRSRAKEWKIDADRIGIMGFSAGGHLAATAGTHYDLGKSDAPDELDRVSCRPDFMVLGYAVISMKTGLTHSGSRGNIIGKTPSDELVDEYSNEMHVNAQTPPTLLVHAKDDTAVPVKNSIVFHEALEKAGVKSEMLLFEKGGHGFGMGRPGSEAAVWPAKCIEWLKSVGMLKTITPPTTTTTQKDE